MKVLIRVFFMSLVVFPGLVFAQYGLDIATSPANPVYIYLGTLPVQSAGNLHKLRVDILGGAWESYSTGETTYYIANRNELKISQITQASGSDNRYILKGYSLPTGELAFYLLTSGYTAIAVKSCMLGGNSSQLISNTVSASPPAVGAEILPLPIMPVLVTDFYGNIGIGMPNPDARLAVNGTMHAREVKVDVNFPPPDYVFEPGYSLTPLEKVEKYIKLYRHLPGIPSANELSAQGINLSEMNLKLLKKVEELTLYQLKQEHLIKRLTAKMEAENRVLKKEVSLLKKRSSHTTRN